MDHIILTTKLKLLNLPDNIIKQVVTFLTDRDQFTKVGDKRSFTFIIYAASMLSFLDYYNY